MSQFIEDISALDNVDLGEIDSPTDDETYEAVTTPNYAPPPAGRYNLQLPTEIKVGAWPARDGKPAVLVLNLNGTTVVAPGERYDGLEIKFLDVNTRRVGGANASSATDLLQRMGISPFPRNVEEWQLVARNELAGQVVEGVYCDWEGLAPTGFDHTEVRATLKERKIKVTQDGAKRVVIRGMKNFPKDEKGNPVYQIPVGESEDGKTRSVYANLKPTFRGFGLTEEERAERAG